MSNTTEMNRHIYACTYFEYRNNCVFQVPKQMDHSLDVNFWTQLKYHKGTIKSNELKQDTVNKNITYTIISDRDHQQVNRLNERSCPEKSETSGQCTSGKCNVLYVFSDNNMHIEVVANNLDCPSASVNCEAYTSAWLIFWKSNNLYHYTEPG